MFDLFLSTRLCFIGFCQSSCLWLVCVKQVCLISVNQVLIGFCQPSCFLLVSVNQVVFGWFQSTMLFDLFLSSRLCLTVFCQRFLSTKLFDCFLPSKLLDCDCFCQPVYLNLFMFDCFLSTSLCLTVFFQSVYVWIFSINQVVLHCCCFFLMKLPVFFTTLWKDKNFNILLQLERLMSNRCRGKQQKKIPVISSWLGRKILAHELTFFWKSPIAKGIDADDFIVYF